VLVTYNSCALLPEFFAGLRLGLEGVSGFVVVVDNASSDGSATVARDLFDDAIVIESDTNLGYAAAINLGVSSLADRDSLPNRDSLTDWDALLILNPDIRLNPGTALELWHGLNETTGITVPLLYNAEGRLQKSLRNQPTLVGATAEALLGGTRAGRMGFGEIIQDESAYAVPTVADWATGALWLISRPCWDNVGSWDETFFLYSEETEYALRAAGEGWLLRLVPSASAVHLGGERHTNPHLYSLMVINRFRLFGRRHGKLATGAFFLAQVINEAMRFSSPIHRQGLRALLRHLAGKPHILMPPTTS
jgi:GT2 family glycosyltransferase